MGVKHLQGFADVGQGAADEPPLILAPLVAAYL
jgi:hypothetical protein